MKIINSLILALENLERREKVVLIYGMYAVVLIIGIFFITPYTLQKINKLNQKIDRETKNYIQLVKLSKEYARLKTTKSFSKPLSLSSIERMAILSGVRKNVVSLKPYGEGFIEITLKKVEGSKAVRFLQNLKKQKLTISYLKMENLDGKNFDFSLVVGQ